MKAPEISNTLAIYGFKPGIVVSTTAPEFGLAALKDALFEGSYSNPVCIPIKLSKDCTASVAVEMVRADWPAVESPAGAVRHGAMVYQETANRYIEGWIQNRSQRVRLYVFCRCDSDGNNTIEEVCLQVMTDSPPPDDEIYVYSVDED